MIMKDIGDLNAYECESCLFPRCTECGREMPKHVKLENRCNDDWEKETRRRWTCKSCAAGSNQELLCSICEGMKPSIMFSAAMRRRFPKIARVDIRCQECQRLRSTNKACLGCNQCGDPSCKRGSECREERVPLAPKALKAVGDREAYECDHCMFPNCTHCGRDMASVIRFR